ncbi:hypothetical protein BpHYR1_053317 [Brachionus plicatilis]|uniref:Uncharacterized protein n=1 Tax=Brachionus plicatilis TaxID=10195 RepID=A0A3M7Q1P5_BRAPC|nr:hypothetical protein BpHYR1_053317 [Brachionus plicatilis]
MDTSIFKISLKNCSHLNISKREEIQFDIAHKASNKNVILRIATGQEERVLKVHDFEDDFYQAIDGFHSDKKFTFDEISLPVTDFLE